MNFLSNMFRGFIDRFKMNRDMDKLEQENEDDFDKMNDREPSENNKTSLFDEVIESL